ncbi:MAG: aspartate 1-decarboxylase [Candidatus Methanoplasma sp.]|nr:aspartate 1-decarboxylase [Candidatus Methanoplasma sp.]
MRWMLRGKIHRATVTETRLDYEGSITIDAALLEKAGIWVGERVTIANVNNGERFETYVFEGSRESGEVAVNGAAARLCSKGDKIIIMGYELTDEPVRARAVLVDDCNRAVREIEY